MLVVLHAPLSSGILTVGCSASSTPLDSSLMHDLGIPFWSSSRLAHRA